jgi:FTR1 family protein
MLPTFVIGLREGLEAALIVGIIAAFLRKQGRRDLLKWMLVGVGGAVGLCVLVGVALDAYSRNLPQKQQEGLETVIGVLAVGMVTYMVVWMRRHSRHLKGQLEGLAADAIAVGGGGARAKALRAMILMAFLAVIREGFETVVFLLAAFNETGSGASAGVGAVLGIAVAVVLGYGIYRGGVRLNLSRFFRATGLVAAGLVVNALHTAHEAGWLNIGQSGTVDLSWLVKPGTVQASLLTGMLGIQPHPVVAEVAGWLVYLVPVGCYVAWPPGKAVPARALARACTVGAAAAGLAAVLLATLAPGRPSARPTLTADAITAQVTSRTAAAATVRTQAQQPVAGHVGAIQREGHRCRRPTGEYAGERDRPAQRRAAADRPRRGVQLPRRVRRSADRHRLARPTHRPRRRPGVDRADDGRRAGSGRQLSTGRTGRGGEDRLARDRRAQHGDRGARCAYPAGPPKPAADARRVVRCAGRSAAAGGRRVRTGGPPPERERGRTEPPGRRTRRKLG